jgi:hypothetical protein
VWPTFLLSYELQPHLTNHHSTQVETATASKKGVAQLFKTVDSHEHY